MLNIKPFKQTDDSRCGPACIKMILDYYEIKDKYYCEVTENEIAQVCGWTYELGCTNMQMLHALESYGLTPLIEGERDLKEIKYWIDQEVPVIVDWFTPGINPELGDMPNGHSSVVVDIDDEYIYLMDPEFGGIRKILHNEFMRVWFDWDYDPWIKSFNSFHLRTLIVALKMK